MSFPFLTGEPLFAGLAALAFLVGAVVNASGHPKVRNSFLELGFPGWWCWITAALESVVAMLLLLPATRMAATALGAVIMLAAIAAILRAKLPAKLLPPITYLAVLALAALTTHS